jgi:nicotinate-nucleotide adenylyltransferase
MSDIIQQNIGILGGTFNPVHMGHLILAQNAVELFDLSLLLFVPSAWPPHKDTPDVLSGDHRLAMIEVAIEGDLRFAVSDVEIRRGGTSYSVDTVREIQALYPDAHVEFIIGSDSLPELHMWKDVYELLSLCEFKTVERPTCRAKSLTPDSLDLKPAWATKLLDNLVSGHMVDISSSDIRYRVAEGMSVRYLLHPAVEMYIAEHSLYT